MTIFGAFSFAEPLILSALVLLPALYVLFRLTPPRPRVIPFPPLELLLKTRQSPPHPNRLPLALIILRLLLLIGIILAMAGPRYEPETIDPLNHMPLLLAIETDMFAAPDWAKRIAVAKGLIRNADASQRSVLLMASTKPRPTPNALPAAEILRQIEALKPDAFAVPRKAFLTDIADILSQSRINDVAYITHGIARTGEEDALDILKSLANRFRLSLYQDMDRALVAIARVKNRNHDFSVRLIRSSRDGRREGTLTARDNNGATLGTVPFSFAPGAVEAEATFRLPTPLRNDIARVEIDNENTAAAIGLVDGSNKRKTVGLIARPQSGITDPLRRGDWYISRALLPYADLSNPDSPPGEALTSFLNAQVSTIILTDAIPTADVEARLTQFVDHGGQLVRFAGPHNSAAQDSLLPVRIRPGDRALGGALAWDTPRTFAPFPPESPFAGLPVPPDLAISRQWLAEPDANLSLKTWASLTDGTPLVTAERRGKGLIVLFHVTSDPRWSNLPLSGLFVEMLRRTIESAGALGPEINAASQTAITAPPFYILDGFGFGGPPEVSDKPISNPIPTLADKDHRAGFYGSKDYPIAINGLSASDQIIAIDMTSVPAEHHALNVNSIVDFRALLLLLCLVLFFIECCATLIIRRGSAGLGVFKRWTLGIGIGLFFLTMMQNDPVSAAELSDKDITAAHDTHLAYVLTGDASVDETSKAGLAGLTRFLFDHTALEPGAPIGVSLATDDIAVYPLLYWPILADRPIPDQETLKKIDSFMRYGGTIVFDTRDADLALAEHETPEMARLKEILANLTVPELETVPAAHVVTKSFYLITTFPGRFSTGTTWIEALPKDDPDGERPVRAGDGVSPLIISQNDLAFAWAIGRDGAPLNRLDAAIPRQREWSLRAGANIVLYILTGNYKADQVHVPALLERLGK